MSKASEARERAMKALQPYIDAQLKRMTAAGRSELDPETQRTLAFNAVVALFGDLLHLGDGPVFMTPTRDEVLLGLKPDGIEGAVRMARAYKRDYDEYVKPTAV